MFPIMKMPSRFDHAQRPGYFLLTFLAVLTPFLHAAQILDPFAENVRTTPHLSPAEALKTFQLPPGFEIQLFASEPAIAKPMNMAFDEHGRLWITDTLEYPFPVPLGQPGRDSVKILEDTNRDGQADKINTFVSGLNIPIGLYPYKNGVVVWSIPNIWFYEDSDKDGKADQSRILFGPMGWEKDTHGMNSSFTRGFDGWLYATHGFNNDTTVSGTDGHVLKMNSGNTYRFRLDGYRIEPYSWGQVNPFGLCFDSLGNLYSADCHSQAVYQLLRGGYYPSFGKPHDGLGFAPTMISHEHGSTAICGIAYHEGQDWPAEFQNNVFTGNVMTSRADRDTVAFTGSTPIAHHRPPLVTTTDPWFRPVNIQCGPDGALYIADFYNRIIGHYEVPLNHPGRDRTSGRIWRISYPNKNHPQPAETPDLAHLTTIELITDLGNANLTRRMLAMNQLTDRIGPAAIPLLQQTLRNRPPNTFQHIHLLWTLFRLDALDSTNLRDAAKNPNRAIRTHAMRILAEWPNWTQDQQTLALAGLGDPDPLVQRCAAEALGLHPAFDQIQHFFNLLQRVPAEDTHLAHAARIALRNQMQTPGQFNRIRSLHLSDPQARTLASVAVAVPTAEAASFLLWHMGRLSEHRDTLAQYLTHTARYIPLTEVEILAQFARQQFSDDIDLQLNLFKSVEQGVAQRGATMPATVKTWGQELATRLFNSVDPDRLAWRSLPIPNTDNPANPWILLTRSSSDGNRNTLFISSLPPDGEHLTGILRSREFLIPQQLSFYLAGHDGPPAQPAQKKNRIRLSASHTGETLAEEFAPRNDLAQLVKWQLHAYAGQTGFLELIDADNAGAFAWIAAGRFEPLVAPLPHVAPSQLTARLQAAAELCRTLTLTTLKPQLTAALTNLTTDPIAAAAAAQALAAFESDDLLRALAPALGDPLFTPTHETIRQAVLNPTQTNSFAALVDAMKSIPYRGQNKLAQNLTATAHGADALLRVIQQGQAPPRLLLEPRIRDRLAATLDPVGRDSVAKLTKALTPITAELQALIEKRRLGYSPDKGKSSAGALLFTTQCAICHQIGGKGALIGPQLDGIGNRGLERLVEDVLDTNRNVDRAFRSHVVALKDGDVVSGLPRREEGELLVLADSAGQEISVRKDNIESRRESDTSPMPENFGDLISEQDFNDLMAFLLSQTGATQQHNQR